MREKVRHGRRILGHQFLRQNLDFFVGRLLAKDFVSTLVGKGIRSTTPIGIDTDGIAILGGNGKFDLVKVGKVLSR